MIKNLQAVADVTKTDRSVVYELTVSGKLKGYKTTAARMHMLLSFVQDNARLTILIKTRGC